MEIEKKEIDEVVSVPTDSGNELHHTSDGKFASKSDTGSGAGFELEDFFDLDDTDLGGTDLGDFFDSMTLDDDLINFKPNLGLTLEELQKIARNSITLRNYDETRKKLIKNFKREFDFKTAQVFENKMREILDKTSAASRFHFGILDAILDSGVFMNQFQSHSSEGADFSSDSTGGSRYEFTNRNFGTDKPKIHEDMYRWEKYGLLMPKSNEGISRLMDDNISGGIQYGDCFLIFNPEKIKGKVTYSVGDSLTFFSDSFHKCAVQKLEDTPDEFVIPNYLREKFSVDNIDSIKDIFDLKRISGTHYIEAQLHADKMGIGEYVSAIAIPHQIINDPYLKKKLVTSMKKAKEKYPNISFISKTKSGLIKEITYNFETDQIDYSSELYDI